MLPRGVRGARHRTGRAIRTFFRHKGTYRIRVSVVDPGGNGVTRTYKVPVR